MFLQGEDQGFVLLLWEVMSNLSGKNGNQEDDSPFAQKTLKIILEEEMGMEEERSMSSPYY